MQKYELLYIVPTQYTDDEVTAIQGTVTKLIETAGGKLSRNENLGKLKLAYPIKRVRHGSYILAHFEAETSAIAPLERQLRLSSEVLRHQLLVLPKGSETHPFQMVSYVAPLSEEAREETRGAERKPAPAAAPAATPAKREETSLSIEELDKKLDEILDADVTKNV